MRHGFQYKLRHGFLTVFIFSLLISLNSYAATYYVKNTGNDGLNGTSDSTAWKTLYKASMSASSGDMIFLKRGNVWKVTHNRNDSLAVGIGLTIMDKNVTVGAYGTGNKPVIDATAKTEPTNVHNMDSGFAPIMVDDDRSGTTIQDLDLRGPAKGPALDLEEGDDTTISRCKFRGSGWAAEALIECNGGSNVTIEDSFFDQITGNGGNAETTGYSKSFELNGGNGHIIRRNVFYGFASGGACRLSDHGTGALIERNYFYHPDNRDGIAWALVIRSANGGTYIVRNNVFDLTGSSGMSNNELTGGRFWYDYQSTTRKIYNNTFISDGKGYGLKGHGDTAYVYNNIFYNLNTAYDNGNGAKLRDNIFWSCDKKYDESPGLEVGSSTANPEIKNPSMSNNMAKDASLTGDSVQAINSGYENDSAIPTDDFNGYERVNIDIGAFEYTDGAPPPPNSDIPSPPINLTIISSK